MLKKIISLLFVLLSFTSVFAADYEYEIANNQVTITKCNKHEETKIIIPNEIEGYPVTAFGPYAFCTCIKLECPIIPASVTAINSNAFYSIKTLKSFIVSPENETFATIDGVLFNKKTKALVLYPQSLVKDFYEIPYEIKNIENNSFHDTKISLISIPSSVTNISPNAFSNNQTSSFIVAPDNSTFESIDGVIFNKKTKALLAYPNSKERESYDIPIGTKGLEGYSLFHSSNLKSITIPESVKNIRVSALSSFMFDTDIVFIVAKGSSAESYCKKLNLNYQHPIDWL